MGHGLEERKNHRKERSKENRNIQPVYIYKIERYRQNAGERSNIKIKYKDQTSRRCAQIGKNDKNVIFREKNDFRIFIG